jgi:heme exporter protein C
MFHSRISLIALAGTFSLAFCQWLVFIYAPEEQVMGLAQKIFYIHLPLAWWGLVSFGTACIASICYLKTHRLHYDHLSHAAVEVGMVCCTLTLITGSIWGRHSWGVWWTWDPRLTTALILWFIYAGCMALRAMPMQQKRRASLCSVVSIAGFLDVPLVFLSARLWRSIHPAVFASQGGGMEKEMVIAVLACILSFALIWLTLLLLRWKQLELAHQLDTLLFRQMMDENNSPNNG